MSHGTSHGEDRMNRILFSYPSPTQTPVPNPYPTADNVIALPGLQMPGLGVASTASKGHRIEGSRNEVWLCQAYANGEQGVFLFIKPSLSLRAMMIEVLAAQVGQCMGLPCPNPYIVTVNPIHVGRPAGPKIVAFGSEQKGRLLARSVLDTDLMFEMLEKQKLTDSLCCFDELIANSVRGPKDIVFDAEHGVSIIDHEGAMEASTQPADPVTNWLAGQVLSRITPEQRAVFLKKLRAKATAAQRMALGTPPSAVQFNQQGVPAYRQLAEFLKDRLTHLDTLLSTRVLPDQMHVSQIPQIDEPLRTTEL